ncbi:MAG: hypothetical protein HY586_05295 [Candidatus Omnitrophica bacterium]|nr:hypothetical protein [Candidatus Omnitrophota bacterium]
MFFFFFLFLFLKVQMGSDAIRAIFEQAAFGAAKLAMIAPQHRAAPRTEMSVVIRHKKK